MMAHLQDQPLLALDTESDSYFRYYPRVCLIQLTAYADPARPDPSQVVDYLLDPLRLKRLGELGALMADPAVQVIIHAAENDIIILQRDFQFSFRNVFDTQLAARILGWPRSGLAAILQEHFGVVSNKRMQLTDWGRRPLTAKQMHYAQLDTHYLPALRERQILELQQAGRWEEAQEAFQALEQVVYTPKERDEMSFWQMKHTRDVSRAETGVLQELWLWREKTAQRLDRPPFKVLNDKALVEIVKARPRSLRQLEAIHGVSERQAQRFGEEILEALERGASRPLPAFPEAHPRPDLRLEGATARRYDALRRWRTKKAQERGVDPDIVFSNEILLAMARRAPRSLEELQRIPGVGPWKAKTYGPEILKLIG